MPILDTLSASQIAPEHALGPQARELRRRRAQRADRSEHLRDVAVAPVREGPPAERGHGYQEEGRDEDRIGCVGYLGDEVLDELGVLEREKGETYEVDGVLDTVQWVRVNSLHRRNSLAQKRMHDGRKRHERDNNLPRQLQEIALLKRRP